MKKNKLIISITLLLTMALVVTSYAYSTRSVEQAGIDITSCAYCGACLYSDYNVGLIEDSGEGFVVWENETARVFDLSLYYYPTVEEKENIEQLKEVCPFDAIFYDW
jgi:ferredoxin